MGEKQGNDRRRPPSLVWPVLLITAGVLILLHNLGVLDVSFRELWRLWPVFVILVGLEILLGRRSVVGNVIVLILTLVVVVGVVMLLIAGPGVLGPSASGGVERFVEPLEGVERAELKVDFAAGELILGELTDSTSMIEGELDLATKSRPVWTADRSGDQASMTLGYKGGVSFKGWAGGDEWDLRLSPRVGFVLDVDVGAGSAKLDLTGLDIRDLKVETGAGRTTVIFPKEGDFPAQISGGVGALVLEIPEGMAVRLRIDRGLGAVDISRRFRKDDQGYVTDDWMTNDNRLDLEIEIGIGLVTVREP